MSTSTRDDDRPAPPRGFAVWLTGLPASGKTTIARALRQRMDERGVETELLDSDELRKFLTPQPRYDERERELFYRAVACTAHHLAAHGVGVLIAATANRREHRDVARGLISRFLEVLVECPLATCELRDPKGLYRRAREGRFDQLPGVGVEYERPQEPDLVVRGDAPSPHEAAELILNVLERQGWLMTA